MSLLCWIVLKYIITMHWNVRCSIPSNPLIAPWCLIHPKMNFFETNIQTGVVSNLVWLQSKYNCSRVFLLEFTLVIPDSLWYIGATGLLILIVRFRNLLCVSQWTWLSNTPNVQGIQCLSKFILKVMRSLTILLLGSLWYGECQYTLGCGSSDELCYISVWKILYVLKLEI